MLTILSAYQGKKLELISCGQEIYFDANNKSQSGKWIPLDKQTGLPHQIVGGRPKPI